MSRAAVLRAAVAGLVVLALAGCGKKPGYVEPPRGRAADSFPGLYPNPALDPKPQPPAQPRTP